MAERGGGGEHWFLSNLTNYALRGVVKIFHLHVVSAPTSLLGQLQIILWPRSKD
jgi:hypothetical protein